MAFENPETCGNDPPPSGTPPVLFHSLPDGSFTPNGPLISSQGATPTYISVWDPPSSGCYANCDGSSAAPILNVGDFVCFMNKYAAGDSYANCDSSTNPPVLNVNDFICFNVRFAVGCS